MFRRVRMLVGLGVLLVLGVLAASAFTDGGGAATTPTDTTPTVSVPTDTTPTGTTATTPTATTPTITTPTVSTVTIPTVTGTGSLPTATTPVRPRRRPRETPPPPVRPPVTSPATTAVTTQVTQAAIPPVTRPVQVVSTVATQETNTRTQPLENSGASTPLASGPAVASAAPAVAVAGQAADTPRVKARLQAAKVKPPVGTAKTTFKTNGIVTNTRSTRKTAASGRGLQASRTATQEQAPPPLRRTKPASHVARPKPDAAAPRLSSSSSSSPSPDAASADPSSSLALRATPTLAAAKEAAGATSSSTSTLSFVLVGLAAVVGGTAVLGQRRAEQRRRRLK
jgi:hypothetical protein